MEVVVVLSQSSSATWRFKRAEFAESRRQSVMRSVQGAGAKRRLRSFVRSCHRIFGIQRVEDVSAPHTYYAFEILWFCISVTKT